MAPLLFVHIPKTAGSSFRKGIDKLFGEHASMRDYGLKSPETSDEVHRSMYPAADPWRLSAALTAGRTRMLVGHFPVMRYAGLFDARKIFTIVREPVQRVVSEYGHYVRHYEFKGSLLEFSRRAPFINRQADMLAGVPPEAIGLIGMTERYEESLSLFEHVFGFRPQRLEENTGRQDLSEPYELSADEEDELRRLNGRDLALYQRAIKIFDRRIAAFASSKPYVCGRITGVEGGIAKGWAVSDASDDPVIVEVTVDDQAVGTASAVEFRPRLKGLGLGRGGYVGFSLPLPARSRKGIVQCRVQGSDPTPLNIIDQYDCR